MASALHCNYFEPLIIIILSVMASAVPLNECYYNAGCRAMAEFVGEIETGLVQIPSQAYSSLNESVDLDSISSHHQRMIRQSCRHRHVGLAAQKSGQ